MVSAGSYILSAALLALLILSLGFSAVTLRRRLMPEWEGAPAHLVEAIVGVALLIWLSELLGVVNLFYAGTLVAAALLLAAAVGLGPRVRPAGGAGEDEREGGEESKRGGGPPSALLATCIAVAVVALVFAHWGLTAKDALGRGVFNFDSLWYHLPFAVEMAHSHSVTGIHYTETVFTNWFYPQNSELLHGVGILLTGRDTLGLFLNFGWLGLAFLAAWCIGRPYGRAPLAVVAAAVILECHTLVVREPGAAKNDLMAAALLLAAIAILVNAVQIRGLRMFGASSSSSPSEASSADLTAGNLPIAVAGLATGLAVGTKSTALAMAAMLTLAVIALAPAGRRWMAAGWWFAGGVAGGGYWYLRNLIVTGNPLPQLEHLGPISLPHPERLQEGRPDFSIAHYATDTGVWQDYFTPGLHQAFGALWPVVIAAAIAGGLVALVWGRPRVLRWMGAVAVVGLIAYIFTPLSAAGADGAPTGFGINIRYAIPALLAGLTLLPSAFLTLRTSRASSLAGGGADLGAEVEEDAFPANSNESPAGGAGVGCRGGAASSFPPQDGSRTAANPPGGKPSASPAPHPRDRTRGRDAWSLWDWLILGGLLVLLPVTNRADAVLRDPDRLFAWLIAALVVLIPAALLYARHRGAPRSAIVVGCTVLALAVLAIGYPVQRDYLQDRFRNADSDTAIPGMDLDAAYRWARDIEDARIGLAGTTAGFLEYGFYGTDLSNRVRYLGVKGPHGAFNAIPTCAGFRAAVNAADLDYLVTAPFLNFIEPGSPVRSPEAAWLRGDPAVAPIDRSGPVTVWRIRGRLDPTGCGPRNAPLRQIPKS